MFRNTLERIFLTVVWHLKFRARIISKSFSTSVTFGHHSSNTSHRFSPREFRRVFRRRRPLRRNAISADSKSHKTKTFSGRLSKNTRKSTEHTGSGDRNDKNTTNHRPERGRSESHYCDHTRANGVRFLN